MVKGSRRGTHAAGWPEKGYYDRDGTIPGDFAESGVV
jgi:hypothetical protein